MTAENEERINRERMAHAILRKPIKTVEEKYKIASAFLTVHGLVKEHIDSFDHFLNVSIKNIVRANNIVRVDGYPDFYLQYLDVRVGMPQYQCGIEERPTTPHECRLRDMTYCAPIYADIQYTRGTRQQIRKNDVVIGRMPIMLRSSNCVLNGKSEAELAALKECSLDPGGYFVVRGTEKVILMQEQIALNKMLTEMYDGTLQCMVTSSTNERKSRTLVVMKRGKFYLKTNALFDLIPIVVVLKAMGVENDAHIMELLGNDQSNQRRFVPSIIEANVLNINSRQSALEYIASKLISKPANASKTPTDAAMDMLTNLVLCHIPVENFDFSLRCLYLGLMMRRMMAAEKDSSLLDDRDYYGNKRLQLAGSFLELMFEDLFKRLNSDLKKTAENVIPKNKAAQFDFTKHIQPSVIANGLESSISSGNWTIKRFRMERKGITQVLCRLSYLSMIGMMTRVNSQFEKSTKVSGPRALQGSQWGTLCPSDTPEGDGCGLIKNLALMAHVTTEVVEGPVIQMAFHSGVKDIRGLQMRDINASDMFLVFINGILFGIAENHNKVVGNIRHRRRKQQLGPFVSIYTSYKQRNIFIHTDGGRLCRPYIIVDNGLPLLTQKHMEELKSGAKGFQYFVDEGIIEYLDVNEENNSFIAVYERDIDPAKTTHLEIEPFTLLGVCVGLVPYPHHNQSPRNTYQCAMGKQAMGIIGYNQQLRMDTLMYNLVYSQIPLVKSRTIELTNFDKLPAGQNAVIAVMSYSGYDIEDAIIMSRNSIQRGFGRCIVYRSTKCTAKTYSDQKSDRLLPPSRSDKDNKLLTKEENLGNDGIVEPGSLVDDEIKHILVKKEVPTIGESSTDLTNRTQAEITYTRANVVYHTPGKCHIERVMIACDHEEAMLVKILMRQTRIPEIGDKFSSRHGQKGVVGLIVNQEDMPFNDSGISPDMIMNPHGFPSRMTVGKTLELLGSKAGALKGNFNYGTAFGGTTLEEIQETLMDYGYNCMGKDIFYSGITGEPLEMYIYSGPVYYQKLKHMVQDKIHARARGITEQLTRQPRGGRAKEGGLRLGEMERDCLISYGASMLIRERLMLSSDAYTVDVCKGCGWFAYCQWCNYCKSSKEISKITLPYAAKLLFQELRAMNINCRFSLDNF